MVLYEIIIGNYGDDTNFSKLVLSNEPLCKNNINIYSIAKISESEKDWYYIIDVKAPSIEINAWDDVEFNQLDNLRQQL